MRNKYRRFISSWFSLDVLIVAVAWQSAVKLRWRVLLLITANDTLPLWVTNIPITCRVRSPLPPPPTHTHPSFLPRFAHSHHLFFFLVFFFLHNMCCQNTLWKHPIPQLHIFDIVNQECRRFTISILSAVVLSSDLSADDLGQSLWMFCWSETTLPLCDWNYGCFFWLNYFHSKPFFSSDITSLWLILVAFSSGHAVYSLLHFKASGKNRSSVIAEDSKQKTKIQILGKILFDNTILFQYITRTIY